MSRKASSLARRSSPTTHRVGVVLVDPLPVVRAGIARLIDDTPALQVLAEASDVDGCLRLLKRIRRTKLVVLVGLGIEGERDAMWLIRAIRERHPMATILACGARADASAVSRSLFVGADGYVDKSADPVQFLSSVEAAAQGDVVLLGAASEWVPAIAEGLERRRDLELRLTERERQVLTLAARGLTAREIAESLGVRERTVTTHLGRIYGKLGVHGRVGAILEAARSGLVSVTSIDM